MQLVHQLLVHLGGLRLDELVVLQRAHRAPEVLRERVELRQALLREVLHRLMHLLVRRFCGAASPQALALQALDILELLLQLVERRREVVALRAPLLGRPQPLEEVLHAVHSPGHAPAREPRERVLEIAAG